MPALVWTPNLGFLCILRLGAMGLLTNHRGKQLWRRASCSHEGGSSHIFAQMEFLKQKRPQTLRAVRWGQ